MIKENHQPDAESLAEAKILSKALPYMRRYSGDTIVVKYGGHAMENPELAKLFASDVVLLRQVGINPVVIHGGGPQIKGMLERLDIESNFVDGLRVTTPEMVDVVEMVLAGTINKQIVTAINAAGGMAVGICGKDGNLIRAQRLKRVKRNADTGAEEPVDLGLVGTPSRIAPRILKNFAEAGIIPVIAPVGIGTDDETLNINADTVAGAIAPAVSARRLMMLTDVEGVLDQDGQLIWEMTVSEAHERLADGTIKGGMIPKVETCLAAMDRGVEGAVIIDGRIPHALLLELFTDSGAGTLILPG